MLLFALRRLALLPVTALFAAALVFLLLHAAEGSPAAVLAGQNASPEQVERIARAMGLDEPWPEQFRRWLAACLRLDLGHSLASGLEVRHLLAQRLPATLGLAGAAFALSLALALPLLFLSSREGRGGPFFAGLTAFFLAVPVFLWAYLLVEVFALRLGWFPAQGWPRGGGGGYLRHLALPALSLALVQAALIARLARPAFLAAAGSAHLRAARARGESRARLLLVHQLRAAAPRSHRRRRPFARRALGRGWS